jgi:hypothetical protein
VIEKRNNKNRLKVPKSECAYKLYVVYSRVVLSHIRAMNYGAKRENYDST